VWPRLRLEGELVVEKRLVVLVLACVSLAVPASASAHARSPAVALDYRLRLDRSTRSLRGVRIDVLDGDRQLRVRVHDRTLVVRGVLGEPMLRFAPNGTWVNRSSTTAVSERLSTSGYGWILVASGASYTWHEHRLKPPPYDAASLGAAGRFRIPATLDGRPVTIRGTFVRAARPPLAPWLGGTAAALAVLASALWLRPDRRRLAATFLGSVAGLAALATLVVFGAADAPNGRIAWVQIALAVALAFAIYGALWRLQSARRSRLAGLLGAAAAAVSLGSLGVFRHGVVISLLPALPSRLLCALALVGGAAAAATSLSAEGLR
jgi:hypothetical protein